MIIATHLMACNKNSSIIHAGNKKEITAEPVVLYVMKNHVHLRKR
jgi:hypothetical protein